MVEESIEFDIPDGEIATVYEPYVHKRLRASDPEIRSIVRRSTWEWRLKRLNRHLRALRRIQRKTPAQVTEHYNATWRKFNFQDLNPEGRTELYPTRWHDDYYMVTGWGIPRVHLYCLMKMIEQTRPQHVLEVGFGSGLNLMTLAARFPSTRFSGIELSSGGFETATALAAEGRLPQDLVQFAPFPLRDVGATREIGLHQGSAETLPFPDDSFDMVFTRQALEQMERIRNKAFTEISRVAKNFVIMFEAFRDWNDKGICRNRIVAANYFAANLAELAHYRLEPVYTKSDLPHKIYMRVGLVVAKSTKNRHPADAR